MKYSNNFAFLLNIEIAISSKMAIQYRSSKKLFEIVLVA